jgi:hypothetical protein
MAVLHDFVRENIPHIEEDIILSEKIDRAIDIIKNHQLRDKIFYSDRVSTELTESTYYKTFEQF